MPAMKHLLRAFALGSAVVLIAATAYAQQAPDTTPPAKVAVAKAPAEPTSDPSFVDTARDWAKRTQILERIEGDVDGWYPRFDITRGSGFAIGPGYRTHVLGDKVLLDVSGALSYRLYKALDVRARWWQGWQERIDIWTD